MKRAFVFKDNKSDKFWTINYSGDNYSVNFGKTGTTGRFEVKEFESEDACTSEALKVISQKVKKGYTEVADFDYLNRHYFDNEEVGLHPKTSHPNFVEYFADDFYYDCGDDFAPFGNDAGNDTLQELQQHIREQNNTNVTEFPRNLITSWEFPFYAPENIDEDHIRQQLESLAPKDGKGLPAQTLFFQIDEVIIATAFGQIKITGWIQDRLRHHAMNSIRRLDIIRQISKQEPSPYSQKMIAALESFPKPKAIEPSEDALKIIEYLNCPCEIFNELLDDDNMIFAYENALKEGREKGYTPLLILPGETLMEHLSLMSEDEFGDEGNECERIRKYRDLILERAKQIDAQECLDALIAELKENTEADDMDWKDYIGKFKKAEENTAFEAYWNYDTGLSNEVILAKIPVDRPWELAAWVPMGGFNDCPAPEKQVAIMKYWYEKYKAVPSLVSYETWELSVLSIDETDGVPVKSKDDAMKLSLEHAAFCQDRIDGETTIGNLAGSLVKSSIWYFWWD